MMPRVHAYDPGAWSTFFATQAGAAAVVMGLVFLAVTINLGQIGGSARLVARAAEALIQLGTVLAVASFALAPQTPDAVGVELLVVGVAASLIAWWLRARAPLTVEERAAFGGSRANLAIRAVISFAATVPFALAGVSILARTGGGLYWVLAGALGAYLAAMFGAWVLVIEIRR
jgi:hypothetical protein